MSATLHWNPQWNNVNNTNNNNHHNNIQNNHPQNNSNYSSNVYPSSSSSIMESTSPSNNININPMTQQFRASDLADSTFIFPADPSTSELPLPSMARDFTSGSFNGNIPTLNNTHNNNNHTSATIVDMDSNTNIPAPFTPLRGLSNVEMSLNGLNDLSQINLNNYDFSVPENFMSAVQNTNTNSEQFAMAMNFPQMNPNEFNFMVNNNTNNSSNNNNNNNNNNNSVQPQQNSNNSIFNENVNEPILDEERNRKRARPAVEATAAVAIKAETQPNQFRQTAIAQASKPINNNNNNGNFTKSNNIPTNNPFPAAITIPSIPTNNLKSTTPPQQPKLAHAASQFSSDNDSVPDNNQGMGLDDDKETQKKLKHQLTDRQRRAKIKESMDALKALVPLEPNQKADQATVVASTVQLVQNLNDQVSQLRAQLKALELGAIDRNSIGLSNSGLSAAAEFLNKQNASISSPYSSMIASLNGAGVSMWRVGLDGKLIEVNMVFEMISGFSSSELVGKSACSAPLYGTLSIMPQSFLRHFSTVNSLVSAAPNLNNIPQQPHSPLTTTSSMSSASSVSGDESPQYVHFASNPHANNGNNGNNSHQQHQQHGNTNLFGNSINQLPIVPQSELQSFFPYKNKSLMEIDGGYKAQPAGQYLINHLANLPPNHVLKLLSRVSTSYGDTLESIVTISLVRQSNGQPDYVLCLSTPDCRRLVKPNNFLRSVNTSTTSHSTSSVNVNPIVDECNTGLRLATDPTNPLFSNSGNSPVVTNQQPFTNAW